MSEIKTLSFFGEDGITSTSANHVANLAKEAVRNAQERLASVTFCDETIGLIGGVEQSLVHSGLSARDLNNFTELINSIAEAHSLIAFFREAIKEKERKMKEAQQWIDEKQEEILRNAQRELIMNKPIREAYPTEESIRQTWSIGEQEKYLSLEAEAAALGKFIHEDGALSRARIDLMHKIANPSVVKLNGSDTIIHRYTPTVSVNDVDELFNSLQKRYRSVQAELNGMKKRIDDEVSNRKMEIDAAYNAASRQYELYSRQHEQEVRLYEDERDLKRNELCKQVRDLKIVIPNRLRSIYEKLTK